MKTTLMLTIAAIVFGVIVLTFGGAFYLEPRLVRMLGMEGTGVVLGIAVVLYVVAVRCYAALYRKYG